MYARHFGLSDEAFSLTPDPLLFFLSPVHAEARAALKIGLQARRGLMVMTGEVGTGKTTLLYSLLSERSDQIHTAYISNTKLTFEEMLRVRSQTQRSELRRFLRKKLGLGVRLVEELSPRTELLTSWAVIV